MFNKKDKKGQIGETITWVVATIIIIVILLVSIFASTSYIGGNKKATFSKQTDILASKSFFAYLLTEDGSNTIYEQLKEEGGENLNEFNGNLAVRIFNGFYKKDYPHTIWLVVYSKPHDLNTNTYFPKPPVCGRGISEEIKLKENKYILLTLTPTC